MYYILNSQFPTSEHDEALIEIHNYHEVGDVYFWNHGEALEETERASIPNPIEINFDVRPGYEVQPPEFDDLGVSIMSKRLKSVLDEAGVSNIEYYPVVLTNNASGETYDYFAYCIVGLIPMADLSASDYESYDGKAQVDTSFYRLTLDKNKTCELKIFRLAEDSSAVLVHESLKQAIEAAGLDTVTFVLPEDYMQL